MKLIVNGQLKDFAPNPATPFLQVINEAKRIGSEPGLSTVQVIVNDEDISGQDWSRFTEKTAADFQRLELVTRDIRQVAREALDSLNEFIPRITEQVIAAAEGFRTGQERTASEIYCQVLDGLQMMMHTERLIHRSLNSETAEFNEKGNGKSASTDKLTTLIEEMLNAQERGDWILLADLLEYELAPFLEEDLSGLREGRIAIHE